MGEKQQEHNMAVSKQHTKPIGRNQMFYSEEDFDMEVEIAENYLEEDLGQTVVVYEVDRKRTQVNEVYKETAKAVRYKAPREIPCMYEIKSSVLKAYDAKSANGAYVINGNLTIYVMPSILVKYRCDIRRGDYIAVPVDVDRMAYFVVVDDGKVNTANETFIGAYKPAWRRCECAPVTLEEFSAR